MLVCFLFAASCAGAPSAPPSAPAPAPAPASQDVQAETARWRAEHRIVDMHMHFDEKKPSFIDDLLKLSDRLNLTACVLTPFAYRKVVAEAAKQHSAQIIPFGSVDLDAPGRPMARPS